MATLTGGPINMVHFDSQFIDTWLNGPISAQSPTSFAAAPAANFRVEYTGVGLTYDANGFPVSGTITGIRVLQFAILWMQFDDIEISVQAYRGFVADNDAEGFFAAIFSGDDIMSRAMNSTLPDQFNGYAGNDSINGNAGDDTLIGGTGNDTLIGALGADKLLGGAGNDSYIVDDSDDTIDETGGSGIDTVYVRSAAFSLYDSGRGAIENIEIETIGLSVVNGNDLANRIAGNGEQNEIYGYGGNDTLDGGGGNDTLVGNFGADKLSGGDGTDSLIGGDGKDTLLGGAGDDFYGIDDGDSVVESLGGTLGGVDTVRYNGSLGSVTLGANVENLVLGNGAKGTGNELGNSITGNSAPNRLLGMAGNDTLQGGAENDTLDGGKGTDLMQGGNGTDTYIVDSVFDVVDETGATSGRDTVESSVSYSLQATDGQVIGDVENLILKGTTAIDGTGNGLANLLTGNSSKNRLLGLEGNDTLDGGAGADTMEGGGGNDTYVIDSKADVFIETGSDALDMVVVNMSVDLSAARFQGIESVTLTGTAALTATGTNTGNQLYGNAGANKLFGFGSLDELRGGAGNDTLDGGEGDDILIGGAGNDTYIVDSTNEIVIGEAAGKAGGFDTVHSSAAAYTMSGNIESLILEFGAANGTGNDLGNLVSGNDLDNFLDGKGGRDTLTGGDGSDTMSGDDLDADKLIGGDGNDLYIAGDGDIAIESKAGAAGGVDTVQYAGSAAFTLGANIENLELLNTGNVSVTGNALNNNIIGHAGNNHLRGMAGNDILHGGGGGRDTLDGGAGADTMAGGGAVVLYVVDNAQDVIDNTGPTTGAVQSSISFNLAENGTTVFGSLQSLYLTGNRSINGTGTAAGNFILGNSGANVLDGGGGGDSLFGGAGNDRLVASDDRADQFDGGTGADTMEAGGGDDNYVVDSLRDVIIETTDPSGGRDMVFSTINYTLADSLENLAVVGKFSVTGTGNSLDNIVNGGVIGNKLFGLGGNDSMFGNDGNDTIDGSIGNDTMLGGEGNDTFLVDAVGDVLDERFWGGVDTAIATVDYSLNSTTAAKVENLTLVTGAGGIDGTGNDLNNLIIGNEGQNVLHGQDGHDTMSGGAESDELYGGIGNDKLGGGTGNDYFFGDIGDDTLIGDSGNDIFFYESLTDGHDLIVGFDGNSTGGQDLLDLESLFDGLGVATADRAALVQTTDRGSAVDVRVDIDGDGTFELFAATIRTSDSITINSDILVGSL